MKFDRIILSTDENPIYHQFWTIVADSWNKFFPCIPISLAFITNRMEDDPVVQKMKEKGDIFLYKPLPNIPNGNLAKVSRFITASKYEKDICLCFDMDSLPLNSTYVNGIVAQRKPDYMMAVAAEVYLNTPHSGKFPSGYFTAEGYLFKELFNPNSLPYDILLKEFIDFRVFDHKEAINVDSSVFSDESLIRALIKVKKMESKIQHVKRGEDGRVSWIDRSCWGIDEDKLFRGEYSLCNMLRPFDSNYDRMIPIIKYIYGKNIPKDDIVFKMGER